MHAFLILCVKQEHYYDPGGNTGYLAWRIKTVQRNTSVGYRSYSKPSHQDSPKSRRETLLSGEQLFGDDCREALSTIRHSTDESIIKERMRATFQYRQKLVHDKDASVSILDVFPRFLDIPGLVRTCILNIRLVYTFLWNKLSTLDI